MAKLIKITQETIEEIKREFYAALSSAKLSDGEIKFTKSFGTVRRDASVYFTELAWNKMQTLIREFDKEVAWHGVAKRGTDPEKDEYIISDILVYPQEVTGATVTTDQQKYQMWLMQQEDEVFNNIRMQGHSHVNMGVTPSGVDTSLYERILQQLEDDMFYIFLIYNKRGEHFYKVYDLAKNILFETADVTVKVLDNGLGIQSALTAAKEMVKDRVTAQPQTGSQGYSSYSPYGGYNGYSGYNGNTGYYGYNGDKWQGSLPAIPAKPAAAPEKPAAAPVSPVVSVKTESWKSGGKKRKGRRKKGKTRAACSSYVSPAYADDDDDTPYPYDGYSD